MEVKVDQKQEAWCANELSSIKLGDERLDRRLLKVANDLMNNPAKPIHVACDSWSEAKAAYRLFDNNKLQEEALLQAHQAETIKRLEKSEEVIFAIQDTTTLNYTHHPKKKGINKINKNPGFEKPTVGCFLHNTLLITERGLPLGLLNQKIFQYDTEEKISHKQRPIIEKLSYRWIESLKATKSLCGKKSVITISDRESDIFELFVEAKEVEANILIRAAKDRILINDSPIKAHKTLWTNMRKIPLAGIQTISLPPRHNECERTATVEVRYSEITFKPAQRHPGAKIKPLPSVTMWAVWLYEVNAAVDVERLEWMLLTNMPVNSVEDAIKMGKWYRLRWQIECYHRILKSGCKVEECRLETYERLKKFIRLKSIIAFRLFWLTVISRVQPEASSDEILKEYEWKAMYCHIKKTNKAPSKPPTVKEAIRMIAKLGGFLERKNDGEPGMTYIWRGWERLALISEFWLSVHTETIYG